VALRYFNVFGPRQDPTSEYSAVIPRFVTAAKSDRPPTIYGDGEQSRDFTYVANVVRANLLACEAGSAALGGAYNIGCGERITLNDLIGTLGQILEKEIRPEHVAPRDGDIRHSLAAIDAARDKLGFRPEVGLVEGLRQTVEAY
jgi:UDP-glucose 4-epimerase